MKKQILCGAAIRDITPAADYLDGIRGLVGRKFGGIHDNLKVRVIAFSNGEQKALIIQPDTDKDQAPVRELQYISQRWGIPEENVLYFGIHTHSAPMHTGRRELNFGMTDETREYVTECTRKYEELFFSMMHEAIDEALNNMKPCRIGCGKAQCYANVRRVQDFRFYGADGTLESVRASQGRDFGANASHEMFVMRVNDMEDKPIAFLVNYPMHCVVMFENALCEDGRDLISGDVAGNISQTIERKFPGAVAAWSSGAAGDMNPFPNSFADYVDPATNQLKTLNLQTVAEELLKYVVSTQYMSVMEAMNNIKYYSSAADIKGAVEVSKTPRYKTVLGPGGRPVDVDPTAFDENTYDVRMQTLRIGDTLLIGMGGELFNSFAEEMKAASPFTNTAVINHNLSLIHLCGYIHDDEALARGYGMRPGSKMINPTVPGYLSDSFRTHLYHMLES